MSWLCDGRDRKRPSPFDDCDGSDTDTETETYPPDTSTAQQLKRRPTRAQKVQPTSMAKVMGINLSELELLRFYYHESNPILCQACGSTDSVWMANVPKLSGASPALKKAAMSFAMLHLGRNRQTATYLLNDGTEAPRSESPPDMALVAGYVPLEEQVLEKMMVEFTAALVLHKKEIENMDETTSEAVLVTSVIIYLVAMSMGPLIPLVNFDGGADLFSITRFMRSILTIVTGQDMTPLTPQAAYGEDRLRLPHEESLWEIVGLVDLNLDYSPLEKRRVKSVLTKEIYSLIRLLNEDANTGGVAHFSAWCTYWQPEFNQLKVDFNPYALILICFYSAYTHMWHILFWWADRSLEDVHSIADHLPEELLGYVQWPLDIVTSYEYNYSDMLTGKLREMSLS